MSKRSQTYSIDVLIMLILLTLFVVLFLSSVARSQSVPTEQAQVEQTGMSIVRFDRYAMRTDTTQQNFTQNIFNTLAFNAVVDSQYVRCDGTPSVTELRAHHVGYYSGWILLNVKNADASASDFELALFRNDTLVQGAVVKTTVPASSYGTLYLPYLVRVNHGDTTRWNESGMSGGYAGLKAKCWVTQSNCAATNDRAANHSGPYNFSSCVFFIKPEGVK